MPPEIQFWLTAPVLVLAGVIVKGIWDFVAARMQNKTQNKQVEVSEMEAQTHQFQAIIDGFTQSLAAVSLRATTAEQAANAAVSEGKRANDRADLLENRVDQLEDDNSRLVRERAEMIKHMHDIEALIPNPPGPPARPSWLR